MKSGIYEIINVLDGKVYIGSSINVDKRIGAHKNDLLKNKHGNIHLQRAYNKDGADSFEMFPIEHCAPKELIEKEQFWMDALDAAKSGYNICPIAHSTLGIKIGPCSAERKRKISEANSGRKFTPEHRQKLSDSHRGKRDRVLSPETRRVLSEKAKKRWADPEFRKKTIAAMKGKQKRSRT